MNDDELDRLMLSAALDPPEDFEGRVMKRLQLRPEARTEWRRTPPVAESPTVRRLRRLAMVVGSTLGAALGAAQVAAFAISAWSIAGSAF